MRGRGGSTIGIGRVLSLRRGIAGILGNEAIPRNTVRHRRARRHRRRNHHNQVVRGVVRGLEGEAVLIDAIEGQSVGSFVALQKVGRRPEAIGVG